MSPASNSNANVSLPSRAEAIALLTSTDTFASTAVGEGAQPSDESLAFARVFLEPDADAVFKQLLAQANVAGRLYALCGLYFTDPETFREKLAAYEANKNEVWVFMGCLKWQRGVSELVKSSSAGAVRLKDADDTVDLWVERNRDLADKDFDLDLIGGGYPDLFRQFAIKNKP